MLNQLTFTRFIAAMAIVIFHYGQNAFPFNEGFIMPFFQNANIGVSYFFILSGFVMVIAYGKAKEKLSPRLYYLNRIARIYPVYLVALLLMVLIIVVRFHEIDIIPLILHLTVTQSWVSNYTTTLNSPGWSLSVEFLFYLLFPFLLNNIYNQVSFKSMTVIIAVIWVASQLLFHGLWQSSFYKGYPSTSHNFTFLFPLMHLNQFMVGNLIGFLYFKYPKKKNYDIHIMLLGAGFVIITFLVYKYNIALNFHNGLMAVIFAPVILLLALNTGYITKVFSHKSLILLGEISYSMYILQSPISTSIKFAAKKINYTQPNVLFYLTVVMIIMASVASYYIIELPARNWIKNKFGGYAHLPDTTPTCSLSAKNS